jgi:hypothetical protein
MHYLLSLESRSLLAARIDRELRGTGAVVAGGNLCDPTSATAVTTVDDDVFVADWPDVAVMPASDLWIVRSADIDQAIAIAARAASIAATAVEIRPFRRAK